MCNASRHGGRYTEPRESREKGSLRIGETLTAGRKALTEILKSPREGALPIALSENIDAAPADLIHIVREFGLEGVVAKRKDSVYESGKRTGAWVKYKVNRGQEFVIGDIRRGIRWMR
jgi:bifunctional non-homologous end joining protein LigD